MTLEIVDFLLRNPYCSVDYLCQIYGEEILPLVLDEAKSQLKIISVKSSGDCYAHKKETTSPIVDLRRVEIARNFVLNTLGKEAAFACVTPGFEADCEYLWKDIWWRVWVDPGGCAPEALGFIVSPPKKFGSDVRDVVLTPFTGRLESLVRQIRRNWRTPNVVQVLTFAGDAHLSMHPRNLLRQSEKNWIPVGKKDMETHIRIRQRGGHKRSLIGDIARKLDLEDWALLVDLGNVPLVTSYELAYLLSDNARKVKSIICRLDNLEDLGLIEIAKSPVARDQLEKRKIITSLGLEMLASHWNTPIIYMRLMQPWPQYISKKDHRPRYSLSWLHKFGNHYRCVRNFALSLVYGARCVSSSISTIDINVITTIGTRLIYRQQVSDQSGKKYGFVLPDGLITSRISHRGWVDGVVTEKSRPIQEKTIWLEVDMGSIGLKKLETKMDGYQRIWQSIAPMNPILVWVIKGSPYREAKILSIMKERNIEGNTILMDRLCIPENDSWWTINTPASFSGEVTRVGLNYNSIAGMAPWRRIWGTTDHSEMIPLLGYELDRRREFLRSPERECDREWVKYKTV